MKSIHTHTNTHIHAHAGPFHFLTKMNHYCSSTSLENITLMVPGSILNTPSGFTVQIHKLEIDFSFRHMLCMTFCLESGLIDWNNGNNNDKKNNSHFIRPLPSNCFFFVVAHCGNSHIQFLCRLPETFVLLLLYLYQIANVITAYNYVFCVINDSGLSVVTVMGTLGDPTTCFSPALFPWHGSSRSRQH